MKNLNTYFYILIFLSATSAVQSQCAAAAPKGHKYSSSTVFVKSKVGITVPYKLNQTTNKNDLRLVTRQLIAQDIKKQAIPGTFETFASQYTKDIDSNPLHKEFTDHLGVFGPELAKQAAEEWAGLKKEVIESEMLKKFKADTLSSLSQKFKSHIAEMDEEILDITQDQEHNKASPDPKQEAEFIKRYEEFKIANNIGADKNFAEAAAQEARQAWKKIAGQYLKEVDKAIALRKAGLESQCCRNQ